MEKQLIKAERLVNIYANGCLVISLNKSTGDYETPHMGDVSAKRALLLALMCDWCEEYPEVDGRTIGAAIADLEADIQDLIALSK
jgi:hypothetical protein